MTVREIEKMMFDNNIAAYVWEYESLSVIQIQIEWGDWKHEHGRTDFLMKEAGFEKYSEKVTEEDGSDCYSSIHQYIRH